MKVLLVMTARQEGGAERYVERLVAAAGQTCDFTIALSDHPDMSELARRLEARARVVRLPFDRARRLPSTVRRLRRMASDHDVVHLNSNHPASRLGILFGFALGAPLVCVEHRVTPVGDVRVPRSVAWALPALFRWSRRNAARVVAVSHENAQALSRLYGLSPTSIEVVHNGVDLSDFRDPPAPTLRQELGLSGETRIVLVLARLQPNKGHRYLIEAAPAILEHYPVHFVFAGSPDERAALDARIAELGLNSHISVLGFRADVLNLLRASDVFVLPSLAEGFALSIIEALAAGLPVVATRVGGAAEIIRDGENGFLVPPENPAELSGAVLRALDLDSAGRERLRAAAMATAAQFSSEAMAEKMINLYRRAARTGPA